MGSKDVSLAAAFDELPPNYHDTKCTVFAIRQQLSDDDDATLRTMLDNQTITSVRISQALRLIGYRISATTVGRHRRGECRCER